MSVDQQFATIYSAMKAMAWEEVKGKLRGFVLMKGSTHGSTDKSWEVLSTYVEDFITKVEDESLHE